MNPLFLRVFGHLLPRGQAFRITVDKTLRRFFAGLAQVFDYPGHPGGDPAPPAREFIDKPWAELLPPTTEELRSLPEWEKQFGLDGLGTTSERRLALAAAWAAQGGQDPTYIQNVLQAAGFDVYVHEWWVPGTGANPVSMYEKRDPRLYTNKPLIGTVQCSSFPSQPQCSSFPSQPQCNAFLANDPGYIVNKDLTPRPPPPIPDDAATWPFFVYIGAATFPERALVPAERRDELERLILKIRPLRHWIVLLIAYGEELTTEAGDVITTEDNQALVA